MFQQRHYIAVAAVLADNEPNVAAGNQSYMTGHEDARSQIAADLADMFAADNPHFKRDVFMTAAKVVA